MRATKLHLVALFVVSSIAGRAHAAPPACRVDLKYTSTEMSCGSSLLNCTVEQGCTEGECDPDVDSGKCLLGDESLFCCAGCQCPTYDGEGGTCLPVGQNGVCLYPEHFDYCSFAPTMAEVEACYTTPNGGRTRSYAEGDCDGDGVANGEDLEVCPPGTSTVPDAGVPDGGSSEPDAMSGGDDDTPPDAGTGSAPAPAGPGAQHSGCSTGGALGELAGLLPALALLLARRRRR